MKSNVEWLQVKSYMPSACFGIRKWHIKTLDTCHGAKRYGGFHCALNLVIFLKFTGPNGLSKEEVSEWDVHSFFNSCY